MNKITQKQIRILSIAPSTRGFGFAVLEGEENLVNWGIKTAKGDKNTESFAKAEKLVAYYRPDVVVLEDASAEHSRRAPRIRKLSKQIIKMAKKNKVKVRLFSREEVMQTFFADGKGTKHELAEIIAQRFPELSPFVPPERKPWMTEDYQMGIFDAVALAVA